MKNLLLILLFCIGIAGAQKIILPPAGTVFTSQDSIVLFFSGRQMTPGTIWLETLPGDVVATHTIEPRQSLAVITAFAVSEKTPFRIRYALEDTSGLSSELYLAPAQQLQKQTQSVTTPPRAANINFKMTGSYLNISSTSALEGYVTIYDVRGRLITEMPLVLGVRQYPIHARSGRYLVVLTDVHGKQVYRGYCVAN